MITYPITQWMLKHLGKPWKGKIPNHQEACPTCSQTPRKAPNITKQGILKPAEAAKVSQAT